MIPRLVVASKNPDKVAEIEAVLTGIDLVEEVVQGLDWHGVPEDGTTLDENALKKGRAVVEETGLPVISDDTGLEVAALDGAPGVMTARYAGSQASYQENVAKLLAEMEDLHDRRAVFRTVVALVMPDGVEVTAEGVIEGLITREPRGRGGFGYDPVFEVEGRTLAEMTAEEKNRMSHRARALRALAVELGL